MFLSSGNRSPSQVSSRAHPATPNHVCISVATSCRCPQPSTTRQDKSPLTHRPADLLRRRRREPRPPPDLPDPKVPQHDTRQRALPPGRSAADRPTEPAQGLHRPVRGRILAAGTSSPALLSCVNDRARPAASPCGAPGSVHQGRGRGPRARLSLCQVQPRGVRDRRRVQAGRGLQGDEAALVRTGSTPRPLASPGGAGALSPLELDVELTVPRLASISGGSIPASSAAASATSAGTLPNPARKSRRRKRGTGRAAR